MWTCISSFQRKLLPLYFSVLLSWIAVKCDPQIHKRIRPHREVLLGPEAAVKSILKSCQLAGLQPAVTPLITQTIKEDCLLHVELKWWGTQTFRPLLSCHVQMVCLAFCGLFPCAQVVEATAAVRQWLLAGRGAWLAGSDQTLVLLHWATGSVDPKTCLRLLVDVLWLSGAMTAWVKHSGVDDLDFLCADGHIRIS